jgi:hypothetical protein
VKSCDLIVVVASTATRTAQTKRLRKLAREAQRQGGCNPTSLVFTAWTAIRVEGAFNGVHSYVLERPLVDIWKSNLTVVKATIRYLQETDRLTYYPEEGQVL